MNDYRDKPSARFCWALIYLHGRNGEDIFFWLRSRKRCKEKMAEWIALGNDRKNYAIARWCGRT